MIKTMSTLIWIGALLVSTSLAGYVPCQPGSGGSLATQDDHPLVLTLRLDRPRQTIDNFGASDCWSGQYVGNWPAAKRDAIADLLFEQGLDSNGRPRGIGLSLWRFNLGAGSNRHANIYDSWRRTDLFLSADYKSYNWNAQSGQRKLIQAAQARGCDKFLMFLTSPPIHMTKNGFGFCDPDIGTTNLDPDHIDDFVRFMVDVLKHFHDAEGVDFTYLSPLNEPQWDWNGTLNNGIWRASQEGCRFSNTDIKNLIDALAPALAASGLSTEILLGEAGSLDYLYAKGSSNGDQLDQFFQSGSANYLGDKLPAKYSAHSYWTDLPSNGLVSVRESVANKCQQRGIEYHMTEYCILGSDGPGRDLGIDPALRIARTIHNDLAVGHASAWQWWLGISPHNYKDGLVYVDKNKTGGNYYESKMLWAMGNYSRFIRPGMVLIDTDRSDGLTAAQTTEGLMASSYHNPADHVLVTVLVNTQDQPQTIKLNWQGLPAGQRLTRIIPYVTSAADSLTPYAELTPGDVIGLPSRSIITLVGFYEPVAKGLVARWRFDGNLVDDDGLFPGTSTNPQFAPGIVDGGQALQLNGTDSIVTTANSADFFNFYPAGYSVNCWIKTSQPSWGAAIAKQDRNSPWRGWVLTADTQHAVSALRQVHSDLYSQTPIKDDRWHMITACYDPDTDRAQIYIDGQLDGETDTLDITAPVHSQPLIFGAETTGGYSPYIGLLDDVRIFNTSLSPIQVSQLYTEVYETPLCSVYPRYDLDHNCRVDIGDLTLLANAWLQCNLYPDCY